MSIAVDQAFIDTVMNGGLAIDIVHENGVYSVWGGSSYTNNTGVYEPDNDREFIEIRNFPAGKTEFTLSDSDEAVGIFQGIIKYPSDAGAFDVKTKAEAFLGLFTIGTAITYSGQKVYPVSKIRDGGRQEGGFYQIVCRVNYRAFVAR